MDPKKLWIGAEWQAERDHYGLDKRCGMFSTERFHEDDKGYVPADLTDALAEAAENLSNAIDRYMGDDPNEKVNPTDLYGHVCIAHERLESALAAYRGEVNE